MLLPHIIAILREEQRHSLARPISVFRDEDRQPLGPTHTYQAPGQGAEFNGRSCFGMAEPEPARVFHFEMGCGDDDDSGQ